jgi:hypothetical protein
MPFAIFRDDFIFNYIDNTGVYGCMGDSLYYYKCKSRCFSLEHCNSSEIEELDFLTTYRVLIQRGCTPRFVKNLIVNRIKQLKIWLYSKSVEQHLYLWLYINAAIMGLTNIDNISNMVYNKEESVILYNKILTFFL